MTKLKLLAGERQRSESNNAVIACNDWLRMGPGRTLVSLLSRYTRSNENSPPTRSEGTLKQWSSRFNWPDRAVIFDARWEAFKNEQRARVFNTELALDFERVVTLNELSSFLLGQLYEKGEDGSYHNLWLPDVKIIGYGDSAEAVDIERFNAPLVAQIRGLLDDIAKETAGRRIHTVNEHNWREKVPDGVNPDVVFEADVEHLLALMTGDLE